MEAHLYIKIQESDDIFDCLSELRGLLEQISNSDTFVFVHLEGKVKI